MFVSQVCSRVWLQDFDSLNADKKKVTFLRDVTTEVQVKWSLFQDYFSYFLARAWARIKESSRRYASRVHTVKAVN